MENKAIKDAIIKHLKKNNVINENFYTELDVEVKKIRNLREEMDNSLFNIKKYMIQTNFHTLTDKIFKGDKEGSLEILKNTKNRIDFYDVTEEIGKLLTLFEEYQENYDLNSPELFALKETFALKDDQLYNLITEISLDYQ